MLLSRQKRAARLFVFTWFLISGIAHFAMPELLLSMMAHPMPHAELCIYMSGALHIVGAFGLLTKSLRSFSGYGLIVLTLVACTANVHMFQHPELLSKMPEWSLYIRLGMQGLLIWMIWWASRADKKPYSFASMKPY